MHAFQTVYILRTLMTVFRLKLLAVLFCAMAFGYVSTTSANESGSCKKYGPLTLGILPLVSAEQLVIRFSPLAQYLSKFLDVQIRIETAPNFAEFARRTNETRRYDILYTAPHFFPQASSKAGYRLVASVDSPGMCAVIAVPKQSQINNINDLIGKKLATIPPMSLATLLVRRHLLANGINPDKDLTMIATPTHNASLLSSYHGVTDASALMQPPYEAASKQVRESMRIIAKTEVSPHIPISVSSRISQNCADEISGLLINMSSTIEGQGVLKHIRFPGFRQGRPEEYERIRDLLVR